MVLYFCCPQEKFKSFWNLHGDQDEMKQLHYYSQLLMQYLTCMSIYFDACFDRAKRNHYKLMSFDSSTRECCNETFLKLKNAYNLKHGTNGSINIDKYFFEEDYRLGV